MSSPKIIYIAGKVSGLPDEQVKMKFERLHRELAQQGHVVVNPADVMAHVYTHIPNKLTWEEEMKVLIPHLLRCHELHLMPCWQQSKGAMLERDIAMRVGMTIVYH